MAFSTLGLGSEKSYLGLNGDGCDDLVSLYTCPGSCFWAHLCWVNSGFLRCRYTGAPEEWTTYK